MLLTKAMLSSGRIYTIINNFPISFVHTVSPHQIAGMLVEYVIQKSKNGLDASDYLRDFWLMDPNVSYETLTFLEQAYVTVINNCPDLIHCIYHHDELELCSVDDNTIILNVFL